ncbi:MAG: xanthine dehydrogenase family protein molybdopterin-binding subunit [Pseudomonadota bacterium]
MTGPDHAAAALLRGAGHFTDDHKLTDPLIAVFLRSSVSAGRIIGLDAGNAAAMPGIQAVHTADDLRDLGALAVNPVVPMKASPVFRALASDEVSAVGQPVALILGESRAAADDALDAVEIDIDDTAPPAAREVAAQTWATDGVAAAFAEAAHVVEATIQHPRLAPSPMEPRSIAVEYDRASDSATIWHSTQTPHRSRATLAAILGIDPSRIHVIAPDVGGAFGIKASICPEDVAVVWAAFHHRRSIRWTATRSEEFLSATHGRGTRMSGRLAVAADGRFLALMAEVTAPLGHWLPHSALVPVWNAGRILPSGYRVAEVDIAVRACADNRAPVGIYRGAGRPEANALMERLVDKAAAAIGGDPLALRLQNMHPPDALPYRTATGNLLDSGDYPRALRTLVDDGHYVAALAARDRRREAGALVGVGLGFFLEPSGEGWESAEVTLRADGTTLIASGSSDQGHSRAAGYAAIASEALSLDPEAITVICGDTRTCPEGIGALASRATAIGGSAVLLACREVAKRRDGGEALPITASLRYENDGQAWGYGCYLVTLSVDRDTGAPNVEDAICVDDAGVIVNEAAAAGQIIGGFAQGLGEAMMERLIYDEDGQLLTGSFMDYAMPRAVDMPPMTLLSLSTPSRMNALGAKGLGEAGTIGAPAAILNAAYDALAPLGVETLDMPLTSATLWQAMRDARGGGKR